MLAITRITDNLPGWLEPNERLYRIDEGAQKDQYAAVLAYRSQTDVNNDGIPDYLNLHIAVRLCNPDGTPMLLDGQPVKLPPYLHKILLNAKVTNQVLTDIADNAINDRINRACTLLAPLSQFETEFPVLPA